MMLEVWQVISIDRKEGSYDYIYSMEVSRAEVMVFMQQSL